MLQRSPAVRAYVVQHPTHKGDLVERAVTRGLLLVTARKAFVPVIRYCVMFLVWTLRTRHVASFLILELLLHGRTGTLLLPYALGTHTCTPAGGNQDT